VKLHEIDVPQVAAARAAVGPDVALMLDTNCPWSVDEALAMAQRLRRYDLSWLEEPVWPPDDHEGLARVRAVANETGMRIAAGENAASPTEFRQIFAAGAVDIAQPSVTKIGGITGALQVYALAAAHGVTIVPHCAYFGQGYLASLHLAASLPQAVPFERLFLDLETSPLSPWTEAKDGTLRVPDGPGLGCDPDMKLVERYRSHSPTIIR